MLRIYKADERYRTDLPWLKSRLSFPFADHIDPDNPPFGPLRVFNEDRIAGGRGFGGHPHREMEIVSVVLGGRLRHEDSLGHVAETGYGEVQRMSAGSGIVHSETNPGEDEVHLLQIWFTPAERGLAPSYETTSYSLEAMRGRLLPLASAQGGEGIARVHQDLTLYISELDPGQRLVFEQPEGRRIYLYVLKGVLELPYGERLEQGDGARLTDTPQLPLTAADAGARYVLIDLP
ncbi:pirin family protein [Paenibacillus sp. IB182496]|uniref:Pirin family protein n=1 Tax=Paenibacillus sabuli TaxID=2772509 RepID=A0A927BSG3_9BACL|nr:pirin-like bicupin family protein [Paenibacillus sabuli]MBD2844925.1 pirin family protein [Paenibacillus sabuli]